MFSDTLVLTYGTWLCVTCFIIDSISGTGFPTMCWSRVRALPLAAGQASSTGLRARGPLNPTAPASRNCHRENEVVVFAFIKYVWCVLNIFYMLKHYVSDNYSLCSFIWSSLQTNACLCNVEAALPTLSPLDMFPPVMISDYID